MSNIFQSKFKAKLDEQNQKETEQNSTDNKALSPQNEAKTDNSAASRLYNGLQEPINEHKQSFNYQPLGFTSIAITISLRARLMPLKEQLKMKSWTDLLNYLLDYCEQLETKLEAYEQHGRMAG